MTLGDMCGVSAATVWGEDAALTATAHTVGVDAALSVQRTRSNGKLIIRTRYVPAAVNFPLRPDLQKLYRWRATASSKSGMLSKRTTPEKIVFCGPCISRCLHLLIHRDIRAIAIGVTLTGVLEAHWRNAHP